MSSIDQFDLWVASINYDALNYMKVYCDKYIAMEQIYVCNFQLCIYIYALDRYVATRCWYALLLFQFHSSYYLLEMDWYKH